MKKLLIIVLSGLFLTAGAGAQGEDPTYRNPIIADDPPARPISVTGGETAPSPGATPIANAAGAEAGGAPPVIRAEIDVDTPVTIPTSPVRTTSISFPFKVEDLHGTGFTNNLKTVKGDFLIACQPGSSYLSITPLVAGVRRNLNVISGGRIYCLDVVPASPAGAAAYSVIIKLREGGGPDATPAPAAVPAGGIRPEPPLTTAATAVTSAGAAAGGPAVQRSLTPPPPAAKPASPERLRGLLTTAKLLSGLSDEAQARQVVAAMPDISYVRRGGEPAQAGALRLELLGVVRNDTIDGVAFAVRVTNTSKATLALDPQSAAARAGDSAAGPLYRSALSQVPASLAAGETQTIFFAVTGSADGARNRLSITNRFSISIDSRPAAKVAARGGKP